MVTVHEPTVCHPSKVLATSSAVAANLVTELHMEALSHGGMYQPPPEGWMCGYVRLGWTRRGMMCINPGHQQSRNFVPSCHSRKGLSGVELLGEFAVGNLPEKTPPLCEQVSLFSLKIPERGHTAN